MKSHKRYDKLAALLPITTPERTWITGFVPKDWEVGEAMKSLGFDYEPCCQDPRNWRGVGEWRKFNEDPAQWHGFTHARRCVCSCGRNVNADEYIRIETPSPE